MADLPDILSIFSALHRRHTTYLGGALMEVMHARSCGLDVHKKSVVACVLVTDKDGSVERHTRTFGTMTADPEKLAEWVGGFGVTNVAMESNGRVLATCVQFVGR